MKRLIRWAAALYPSAWRERYGTELDALMEDMDAGWLEFWDICTGAIKMQILSAGVWRFAAASGLAGLLVAGVVALRIPAQYRSQAVLRMPPGDRDERNEKLRQAAQTVLSSSWLSTLVQGYDLYPDERKKVPLEDIVQGMRKNIQLRIASSSDAFSIRFDSDDPGKALGVTRELTGRFIAAMKDTAPLELLDPANRPVRPFRPNRPAMLMAGLVLGIVTGIVLAGIRRSCNLVG